MFTSIVYGASTEKLLNRFHSSLGADEADLITHRSALTTNDTFFYGTGDDDQVDLTGWKRVKILADIGGNESSWDLTPYYGNATVGKYFSGDTRTITSDDEIYTLDVNGEDEFILRAHNSQSSSSATLTLYLIPFNN